MSTFPATTSNKALPLRDMHEQKQECYRSKSKYELQRGLLLKVAFSARLPFLFPSPMHTFHFPFKRCLSTGTR